MVASAGCCQATSIKCGFFVVGMIVGFAASVYLIVKRYGIVPDQNNDREGQ
ncbi:ATP synthase protein I [Cutibacterium acnes JCM 18909]|nr:ATP synthase protein I [Cutibacterium acnes JCM 18909]